MGINDPVNWPARFTEGSNFGLFSKDKVNNICR